MFRLSQKGV